MFIKLRNNATEPVNVVLMGVKEVLTKCFAKCNSEKEVVLLKKVLQDMLNDEADLRKDQL